MSDEDVATYESNTVAELKEELDARGVEYPSSALKADLIALLEEDDASVPDDGSDAAEDDTDASPADLEDVVVEEHNPEDWVTEQREAWLAEHPDATTIPPSLLPAAYRDGTEITPGLPAA